MGAVLLFSGFFLAVPLVLALIATLYTRSNRANRVTGNQSLDREPAPVTAS